MSKKLISYGGGVNSTALVIMLYRQGYRYPVVFADTGTEQPETVEFIEYFRDYLKKSYDTDIVRISPAAHKELYDKRIRENEICSIEDYCKKLTIVPLVGTRWCTGSFKIDPVRRWGKQGGIFCHLIGFSIDEDHRAKYDFNKYREEYPLIENRIDRAGCAYIIKEEGLYIPRKSGCYFCPYQKEIEWRILKESRPDLFETSKELEEHASKCLGRKVTMQIDGTSIADLEEGWKQENPLFPELHRRIIDSHKYDCPYCHL